MDSSLSTSSAVFSVVVTIINIVAWWKVFTKADEKGWKAIIPILNGYTMYKICWKPLMFWIALVCGAAAGFVYALYPTSMAVLIIAVVLLIISGVISIISDVKLSKAFGHGAGFAVGLIFLGPIFMLILAFGSSKYVGNGSQNTEN